MKSMKFILVMLLFPICLAAQVKVQADGKFIIGNNKTYANGMSMYDTSGTTPFRIFRENNYIHFSRGTDTSKGFRMNADGTLSVGILNDGHVNYGASITANSSTNSNFTSVTKFPFNYGAAIAARVNNPLSLGFSVWLVENGVYNRRFYVTGNGDIYVNEQYVISDASVKKNIKTLDNALAKIMKLRGVEFDSNRDEQMKKQLSKPAVQPNQALSENDENNPGVSLEIQKQIASESNRKRIGVLAQEVEAVIPEAVRTTPDGIKAVSYTELIGVLIEAVKEQQLQIEELKKGVFPGELRNQSSEEGYDGILAEVGEVSRLYQNAPNPFSDRTEIRYFLTGDVNKASLYIYDMQGKQLKNIEIAGRGDGQVTVNGSELGAGMYIYTLIADGNEVDTKRMILTK